MIKICIILGTLCLLAAAILFVADEHTAVKSLVGQKAPPFEAEKWLTARPDYKNKFVLIDFWATWCASCRPAILRLNALHKRFGDKLVIIGLSDEPEAQVRAMTTPRIDYYVAIDTQARMKKALGIPAMPHVILLDPRWIVRWSGYPLLEGHELTEKVVADILAKYGT